MVCDDEMFKMDEAAAAVPGAKRRNSRTPRKFTGASNYSNQPLPPPTFPMSSNRPSSKGQPSQTLSAMKRCNSIETAKFPKAAPVRNDSDADYYYSNAFDRLDAEQLNN